MPTALKLARGCPSGERKLPKGEAKPEVVKGVPPYKDMSDGAKAVWAELTPKLEVLGLLTEIDLQSFRRYCDMQARWLSCAAKLKETDKTFVPVFAPQTPEEIAAGLRPQLRFMQELPESIEYRRLLPQLIKLEAQFGLTPASRASISILPPSKNKPVDLEGFLFTHDGDDYEAE
jgi:P27 family predicted phage terminase small subunit